MSESETFAKKIKELSIEEVEYTDDFFIGTTEEKSSEDDTLLALKKGASQGAKRTITDHYSAKNIDADWLENSEESFEGQLAVDVFQTKNSIIITSTVAGVKAENLDVQMHGDMITIKGRRHDPAADAEESDFFIKECYWGGFSRSIILPVDIQHDKISATMENGILTITLPKSKRAKNGKIAVVEVHSEE